MGRAGESNVGVEQSTIIKQQSKIKRIYIFLINEVYIGDRGIDRQIFKIR